MLAPLMSTGRVNSKQTVEVRFQAHPDNMAGGLYGARLLKPMNR